MKKLFLIVTLLLTLFINTAFAANGSPQAAKDVSVTTTAAVVDRAKLLNTQEAAALEQQIKAVEQKHGVKVMVYTAQRIAGGVARDYARTVVDKKVPNKKAIICVITMGDRQWYLAANKLMKEYAVTQEYGIDYISDDMVPYLKDGKYAKAFSAYVTKTEELLDYAKENGHPNDGQDDIDLFSWGISLLLAGLIGYCVREHLISTMSNVTFATEASEYLVQDSFKLEEQKDTYLYTHTSVVPKSHGNDGGGGGGSDGDSGGSGGGGGF